MDGCYEEQVLGYLRRVSDPIELTAIATALEFDRREVESLLRRLIRRGKVRRHHVGPNCLRYSATKASSPLAAWQQRAQPVRYQRPSPKQETVLQLLGHRRMTIDMIADASAEFTPRQVSNLLTMLRMKGLVSHGNGRKPFWHAITSTPEQARPPLPEIRHASR